ncbi:acetylglutamate kinase [Marinilabiliaceae bacterium JC017]|nr:acetylglutamate kinase [Marinilabiliaceae bacterium JC017]
MAKKLTIIKVGGKVVEDKEVLNALLDDFATIEGPRILVHGGGSTATKLAGDLGIETQMHNGRRITSQEMLEVATMVYAGLVNKNIVAQLQSRKVNAIGLTGADLNLITATKRPVKEIDFGYVGDIISVQASELTRLVQKGVVPVIAPLTHDGNGQLLNTNADTMASALAQALIDVFEVRLVYCFEKRGVLNDPDDDNSVVSSLSYGQFKAYQDDGTIAAGMIPKLDNGFDALKAGVREVIITNTQGITNLSATGTHLLNQE